MVLAWAVHKAGPPRSCSPAASRLAGPAAKNNNNRPSSFRHATLESLCCGLYYKSQCFRQLLRPLQTQAHATATTLPACYSHYPSCMLQPLPLLHATATTLPVYYGPVLHHYVSRCSIPTTATGVRSNVSSELNPVIARLHQYYGYDGNRPTVLRYYRTDEHLATVLPYCRAPGYGTTVLPSTWLRQHVTTVHQLFTLL